MEWVNSSVALPTTETPVLLCVRTGAHCVFHIGELVSNHQDTRWWCGERGFQVDKPQPIPGVILAHVTHWAYITTPT
jgi:hypothetical protein